MICPLMSDRKEQLECIESKCAFWTQVRGTHPQSGEEVDKHGCAIAWMPVLLIENAQQSRQTGAAVESFRNKMVGMQEHSLRLMREATMLEDK